jgi:predicted amidohydrolase YtcJ
MKALYEPYLSGETGLLLQTDQDLSGLLKKAADFGKPVCVHTIGNRSTQYLIAVLEELNAHRPCGICSGTGSYLWQ